LSEIDIVIAFIDFMTQILW